MPATHLRSKYSRVTLGVGIAVLMAVGVAGLVHVLSSPSGTSTEPAYSVAPMSVALTTGDVGPNFPMLNEGEAGPSQRTAGGYPAPYQKQFIGGWARYFMVHTALVSPGRTEIESYEKAHGFPPTDPPTIIGPFVSDHHGLFEVDDIEVSYHLASAAHFDYLVSHPGDGATANYMANYGNWRTYPVQLGDEADAWGGIRDSPTNPPQDYEEQTFRVR